MLFMETLMAEPLQQVCVSLPPNLIALLQRHATATDRTLGGMVRHIVSEWARGQPPPSQHPTFPDALTTPIARIAATPDGIAEGNARIARLERELEQISRRQRLRSDTAGDEDRKGAIYGELKILRQDIELAEKMMPRSANGG
jgi:hypothetical protein